jgi:hypothetical protein
MILMRAAILEIHNCQGIEFVGSLDEDGVYCAVVIAYVQYEIIHIIHSNSFPSRDLSSGSRREFLKATLAKEAQAFVDTLNKSIPQSGS